MKNQVDEVEKLYTEDELVRFGRYLMSDERKQRFMNHPEFGNDHLEERIREVQHADISNFEYFNFKFREGDFVKVRFTEDTYFQGEIISCQKSGKRNIYGLSVRFIIAEYKWNNDEKIQVSQEDGFTRVHNIEEKFLEDFISYSEPK